MERVVTIKISAQDAFTNVMQKYERGLEDMSSQTRNTESAMGMLKGAVGGFIAGLAVEEVIRFGVETYNLGRQVEIAESAFNSLTDDMGGYDRVLNMMRDSTRGAVSDLQLMDAANAMIATGVVDTAEEMSRITSNAIVMGRVLGNDIPESLNQLNSALMNQSYLRLDSLGVSSARVKEHVEELTAAGMDLQDAFAQGLDIELQRSVENVGAAAEETFSEVDKLLKRFEDFRDRQAAGVSAAVEELAADINALIDFNPDPLAGNNGTVREITGPSAPFRIADLFNDKSRGHILGSIESDINAQFDMYETAFYNVARTRAATFGGAQLGMGSITEAFMQDMPNSPAMPGFITDEALFDVQRAAERVANHAERAKQAFEDGLITEEQNQLAQGFAEQTKVIVDHAERANAAYNALDDSLSNLFQQQSGGALGEIGDLLGQRTGGDQALADAFGLASGSETTASLQFRDQVLPRIEDIYHQLGADAAVAASQSYIEGMQSAALQGVVPDNPLMMLGFRTGEDGSFIPDASASVFSQREDGTFAYTGAGETATDPFASMTDSLTTSSELMPTIAENAGVLKENMLLSQNAMQQFAGELEKVTGTVHEVQLKLTSDTKELPPLMVSLIEGLVVDLVKRSGGAVPGTDPRAAPGQMTPSPA